MYTKIIKKLLASIICILLLISILSGCVITRTDNEGKETTYKTTESVPDTSADKPIKLSMLFAHAGIEFKKPTLFQKVIKEKFNIEIEYVEVPPNNFEKVEILFATGEYPEFLPQFWDYQQIRNYRREGFLLPLDDIFNKIPNYRKRYTDEEWEEMLKMIAYRDKHHWLPVKNYRKSSEAWIYRKDLFDSLGLQPPKTVDEMYDTLMKIKKENVSELIFAHRYDVLHSLMIAFATTPTTWVNPITNKFEVGPDTAEFREALKFARELYKSGLLAMDFPTWTPTQFDNAVSKGNVAYIIGYATDINRLKQLMEETIPNAEWAISPYFLKADASKPAIFKKEQPWFDWGICITDKTPAEKMDRIAQMIDWFSTREGNDFLWIGPEGVTYDIIDNYYVFKDEYKDPNDPT
jgi:putative aldouronate transport system substrate-binding protein